MDQPDPMRYQMLAARLDAIETQLAAMRRGMMPVGDQLVTWQRSDYNTWASVTSSTPLTDYAFLPMGYTSGDVLYLHFLFRLQAAPTVHGTVRFRVTDAVFSTTFDLPTTTPPSPGNPTYWWNIQCAWLHPFRCWPNDMRIKPGGAFPREFPSRTFLSFQVGGLSGNWAGAVMSPWTGKFTSLEAAPTATSSGAWAVVT